MTKIKVVGIGGSGGNAVSRMAKSKIKGVELIALNTDAQDLKKTNAQTKLRIGEKITQGLGTGMDPEIGKKAALESKGEISEVLSGSDMIFLTFGAGGGTGTGAGPVVAEAAKNSFTPLPDTINPLGIGNYFWPQIVPSQHSFLVRMSRGIFVRHDYRKLKSWHVSSSFYQYAKRAIEHANDHFSII